MRLVFHMGDNYSQNIMHLHGYLNEMEKKKGGVLRLVGIQAVLLDWMVLLAGFMFRGLCTGLCG